MGVDMGSRSAKKHIFSQKAAFVIASNLDPGFKLLTFLSKRQSLLMILAGCIVNKLIHKANGRIFIQKTHSVRLKFEVKDTKKLYFFEFLNN